MSRYCQFGHSIKYHPQCSHSLTLRLQGLGMPVLMRSVCREGRMPSTAGLLAATALGQPASSLVEPARSARPEMDPPDTLRADSLVWLSQDPGQVTSPGIYPGPLVVQSAPFLRTSLSLHDKRWGP